MVSVFRLVPPNTIHDADSTACGLRGTYRAGSLPTSSSSPGTSGVSRNYWRALRRVAVRCGRKSWSLHRHIVFRIGERQGKATGLSRSLALRAGALPAGGSSSWLPAASAATTLSRMAAGPYGHLMTVRCPTFRSVCGGCDVCGDSSSTLHDAIHSASVLVRSQCI
jgi:hypothetical protein